MDPVSAVIRIASGAATLVAMSTQTVKALTGLRDTVKNAELIVLELLATCQAFTSARFSIYAWTSRNSELTTSHATVAQAYAGLQSYLEISSIVFNSLQKDILRIFSVEDFEALNALSRKRTAKVLAKIALHEYAIKTHCDRLNRQITSLHLLLSTAKLESGPLQAVVMEALQPVFRKDEETAWTIASTRPLSSRFSRSSLSSASRHHHDTSLSECAGQNSSGKFSITLQNDLFTGPVYNRLLYNSLRNGTSHLPAVTEAQPNTHRESEREIGDTDTARYEAVGRSPYQSSNADTPGNGLPESFQIAMRSASNFSISCVDDLREIQAGSHTPSVRRRYLPLSSYFQKQEMTSDDQDRLNRKFMQATNELDVDEMVHCLDEGADVNYCGRLSYRAMSGSDAQYTAIWSILHRLSVLDIDRNKSEAAGDLSIQLTQTLELLMLYKETTIPVVIGDTTTLHICFAHGLCGLLRRLGEDYDLGELFWQRDGSNQLPVVVSTNTLNCLQTLNAVLIGAIHHIEPVYRRWEEVFTSNITMKEGIELLQFCLTSVMPRRDRQLTDAASADLVHVPQFCQRYLSDIEYAHRNSACNGDYCPIRYTFHRNYHLVFKSVYREAPQGLEYALRFDNSVPPRKFHEEELLVLANSGKTPGVFFHLIRNHFFPRSFCLDISSSIYRFTRGEKGREKKFLQWLWGRYYIDLSDCGLELITWWNGGGYDPARSVVLPEAPVRKAVDADTPPGFVVRPKALVHEVVVAGLKTLVFGNRVVDPEVLSEEVCTLAVFAWFMRTSRKRK